MNANTLQAQIESAVATAVAAAVPSIVAAVVQSLGTEQAALPPVVTAPTAPAEYRVRTDRQKDASHRKIAEVNVRFDMKLAGGSRKVSDLGAKERKAYDAAIKACWTKPAGKTVTR